MAKSTTPRSQGSTHRASQPAAPPPRARQKPEPLPTNPQDQGEVILPEIPPASQPEPEAIDARDIPTIERTDPAPGTRGRVMHTSTSTIPVLERTVATALCFIAARTHERPETGCTVEELERFITQTLGAPTHAAVEKLFNLGTLIDIPRTERDQPMTRNLVALPRGLSLANDYMQRRLTPVPDPVQPPGVQLVGDGEPIKLQRDTRPAPDGYTGTAQGLSRKQHLARAN